MSQPDDFPKKKQSRTITTINRAGLRPYRLHIDIEGQQLRVKLDGHWAFRDSNSFWQRIFDECRANSLNFAVVMFQFSKKMSIQESHALAGRAIEIFSGQGIQLAIVDINRCSFASPGFWNRVSGNESFSTFFQDMAEAEAWLDKKVLEFSNKES